MSYPESRILRRVFVPLGHEIEQNRFEFYAEIFGNRVAQPDVI